MNMKCSVALLSFTLCSISSARAQTLEWIQQFGTSEAESVTGVSADGLGNVYIAGETKGSLGGPNAGWYDAYIAKYDASGNRLWTEQFGTSEYDSARGVSADGLGNVYIVGSTEGSLWSPNAGGFDAFIAKYDASGNRLWTEQFGTSELDSPSGVSADGLGNVYVSGTTWGSLGGPNAGGSDTYIAKYDASGNRLWTEQFGTSEGDNSWNVSADGLGNVYISGTTEGSLGGPNAGGADAFIAKYDASGNRLWTEQFGTSEDDSGGFAGVSADGLGNVYIAGRTSGSLGGPLLGGVDAYMAKYDASGSRLWIEQFGTSGGDVPSDVTVDGIGNVYMSGWSNAGGRDGFVSKYDESGTLVWTQQIATSESDWAHGVSPDGLGNVYVSGTTDGNLGGPNAGGPEVYLMKLREIPEPGDFNLDGAVGISDIDLLSAAIRTTPDDPVYDLNDDNLVDGTDHGIWVRDLKGTWYGDANLDLEFNSSDMTQVFAAGKYETGEDAGWAEGDWNGDGFFSSRDMVAALVDGGYEKGPRTDVAAVPEPTSVLLLVMGLIGFAIFRRRLQS